MRTRWLTTIFTGTLCLIAATAWAKPASTGTHTRRCAAKVAIGAMSAPVTMLMESIRHSTLHAARRSRVAAFVGDQ